jgi:hypothetical protein
MPTKIYATFSVLTHPLSLSCISFSFSYTKSKSNDVVPLAVAPPPDAMAHLMPSPIATTRSPSPPPLI